ncbi:exo-alpha-sialidase [Verrucomicrobiaceae bacterium N1E253]|uniref:exo-alpha-sialidase n=1 Tax=Oceaniferula marina TaxID=2748318 RepID=A0A851GE80_9BACT|nr:sialidase family protein [Oceaniferula marina]NWK55469.1 exo-alpha-sialidase [Oceaniferula marina]
MMTTSSTPNHAIAHSCVPLILATLLVCWLYPTVSRAEASAVEGLDTPVLVFKEGEAGYPYFRIPTITRSQDGTLLAFAEGRFIRDDHGRNDIVLKRSADGGKTWGELQVIHADQSLVMVNPSPVTLDSGRILLFYETFPHGYHARVGRHHKMMDDGFGLHTQKLLVRASDDDGKSWSKAVELQKTSRKDKNIISSGSPANAIQLQKGKHKGRIVLPMFLTEKINDKSRTWKNAVLYSDDMARSWKRSAYVPVETTETGNECLIAEIGDGHILMNARSQKSKHRLTSISKDGGASWSPFAYSQELKNRPCNCGLVRFPVGDSASLFFSYNNSLSKRANGHIAMSKDDGTSWPINKQVIPGLFGYSQLVPCDETTLGMIYEPFESVKEEWSIYFLRIPLEWMEK